MLTKAGVPWDVVMSLDDVSRRGFCVAAGIVDGNAFDWQAMKWTKPNA